MKKWLEPLTTAWSGVVTHKLRSILTMLGIVIGVSAVIALMSIGNGAQAQILSQIEGLGSNLIFVSPGASTFGGVSGAMGSSQSLTLEDADAIAEQVSNISSVSPVSTSSMQVAAGSENSHSQITGTTAAYMKAYNLSVANGSFFTSYDELRASKVVVLGADIAETIFGESDPVGQTMRMGTNIVHVIGVLDSKGTAIMGSVDNSIFVPLSAMQQMVSMQTTSTGESIVSSIAISVTDEDRSDVVVAKTTALLRTRHRLATDADDDFTITSMEEIASMVSEALGTFTLLLGAIAAISLLVGGIGVMNIMLVSVLERTKEIGIRKALGAKEMDIWIQFLVEAAFLTFAGGLIGILLGWGASLAVTASGIITTMVTADVVILAVSVSVGIGLFFGFYPAWNASRLNPIEALRSE